MHKDPGPPRPLPIRPRPITGETTASYIRRLAHANHLRPAHLRRYLQAGSTGPVRLDWLAAVAGRSPTALGHALAEHTTHHQRTRHQLRQADKPSLYQAIRADARTTSSSIRFLADRYGVHRRTVRDALTSPEPTPRKKRTASSRLDPYQPIVDSIIHSDREHPNRRRHTTQAVLDLLTTHHGATGLTHSTVRDYLTRRRRETEPPQPAGRNSGQM